VTTYCISDHRQCDVPVNKIALDVASDVTIEHVYIVTLVWHECTTQQSLPFPSHRSPLAAALTSDLDQKNAPSKYYQQYELAFEVEVFLPLSPDLDHEIGTIVLSETGRLH
jgi:hypothetical protein